MRIEQFNNPYVDYEERRAGEIPSVSVEEVKRQDAKRTAEENTLPQSAGVVAPYENKVQTEAPDTRSRTADLENISLSFNREESYGYIGSEKDINGLDMKRAISDMQKDSVLQEYQYFVGSAVGLAAQAPSQDGMVFLKEPV